MLHFFRHFVFDIIGSDGKATDILIILYDFKHDLFIRVQRDLKLIELRVKIRISLQDLSSGFKFVFLCILFACCK